MRKFASAVFNHAGMVAIAWWSVLTWPWWAWRQRKRLRGTDVEQAAEGYEDSWRGR